jgi:hypothetical protein
MQPNGIDILIILEFSIKYGNQEPFGNVDKGL